MARPLKKGLVYFPFDINFFSDIKIRKLVKYQGGRSTSVYACLLCNIYKDGYYLVWDDELPFIVSELTGCEEAYIQEVIKSCLNIGLFSKEIWEKDKVLTSLGIQLRYDNISKLLKKKALIDEFSLVNTEETPVNTEETYINTEETPINSGFSTQRKGKEIKGNKKERDKEKNSLPISPDILNLSEKSLEECFNELKANQSWKETLCMNTRIRDKTFMPADFDQYLKQFFRKLANEGETKKAPKDAMSHFARWLDIELRNKSNEKSAIKNQRDSEQRKNDSITAISTTVMEAAERRRAELEAEGVI